MKRNQSEQIDKENIKSVNTQAVLLARHLLAGKTFHCKMPARQHMAIGYPNSRISALRKMGITIETEKNKYTSTNINGSTSRCNVYYISITNVDEIKNHLKEKHRIFYERIIAT